MRILDWLFGPQNSNVSVYAIQPESTSYQPANQEGETERGVASSLSSTYPMGDRSDDESSQTDAIAIVQLSRPGIHERLDSERPSEKLLDVVQSMRHGETRPGTYLVGLDRDGEIVLQDAPSEIYRGKRIPDR